MYPSNLLLIGGIRRVGNKTLPKLNLKERKNHEKEEEKDEGQITERDFKNPKIIAFETTTESAEKPSWRDLEKDLQEAHPTLKLLYSRMEEKKGQVALSSQKLDTAEVDKIYATPFKSAGFEYTFHEPSEEDLKKFWEEHGSHYEMVTKQKMRRMKKRKREEQKESGRSKAQKTGEDDKQYIIAGITYANINKVKSKAKAIMNIKEDGQKLEGYEEEFMKEIIKHHPKHDEKMNGTGEEKGFSHFAVDQHPNYKNTRCFFVVRQDGSKEDFSMSKCIQIMEDTQQ